jgi:hypothetical protein
LNTNQFKELGKEFNIYQLKLKLFTILKEKNMLLDKDNTLRVELQLLDQLEPLDTLLVQPQHNHMLSLGQLVIKLIPLVQLLHQTMFPDLELELPMVGLLQDML